MVGTVSMLAQVNDKEKTMPKYVIERELPGAGNLSAEELQGISATSNKVIGELGPEIRWLTSYVTDDKIYCVYVVPANRISMVSTVIDPSTGD